MLKMEKTANNKLEKGKVNGSRVSTKLLHRRKGRRLDEREPRLSAGGRLERRCSSMRLSRQRCCWCEAARGEVPVTTAETRLQRSTGFTDGQQLKGPQNEWPTQLINFHFLTHSLTHTHSIVTHPSPRKQGAAAVHTLVDLFVWWIVICFWWFFSSWSSLLPTCGPSWFCCSLPSSKKILLNQIWGNCCVVLMIGDDEEDICALIKHFYRS